MKGEIEEEKQRRLMTTMRMPTLVLFVAWREKETKMQSNPKLVHVQARNNFTNEFAQCSKEQA